VGRRQPPDVFKSRRARVGALAKQQEVGDRAWAKRPGNAVAGAQGCEAGGPYWSWLPALPIQVQPPEVQPAELQAFDGTELEGSDLLELL